jgi:hypothetical protein
MNVTTDNGPRTTDHSSTSTPTMRAEDRFLLFLLSICLVLLPGCGSGNVGRVSGQVTVEGEALETGTVTFHPMQDGPLAIGQIGPGGRYELQIGDDASMPPGDYLVTVVAAEIPAEDFGKPEAIPKLLIPSRYTATETSGLKFTVKPGGQTIDLPLRRGE